MISPGPASPLTPHVIEVSGNTADPPPARYPPWWSWTCDDGYYPGSFTLSSWDGLTGAGPVRTGVVRTPVAFFPSWGSRVGVRGTVHGWI